MVVLTPAARATNINSPRADRARRRPRQGPADYADTDGHKESVVRRERLEDRNAWDALITLSRPRFSVRFTMPPSRKRRRSRKNPPLRLQEERIRKGGQIPNKYVEKWNARFKELLDYRSEHGNCDVPCRQGQLGNWVGCQRLAHKADSLTQERIDQLSSIGFKWSIVAPVPWKTRFNELVNYKAKHGDCNIPQSRGPLGRWVHEQRKRYNKGKLSQDRNDRLNGIGFDWTPPRGGRSRERPWEIRFNELVQYKAKHGDCNVPNRQGKLGTWADKQRSTYKKDKLSQDRIDRLNGIGFDWTPPRGKRKAIPSSREQSSSRQMRVPSPCTNVQSLSIGARARGVESDGIKGKGFDSEISLPLQIPSKSKRNLGSESDDEVDEIGALIYDQVMQQRQIPMKW